MLSAITLVASNVAIFAAAWTLLGQGSVWRYVILGVQIIGTCLLVRYFTRRQRASATRRHADAAAKGFTIGLVAMVGCIGIAALRHEFEGVVWLAIALAITVAAYWIAVVFAGGPAPETNAHRSDLREP